MDPAFPRILEYRADGRIVALGSTNAAPLLDVNDALFTLPELKIASSARGNAVYYQLEVPALKLALNLRFRLEGSEVVLTLTRVEERGKFRMNSLYFPEHCLVRMPALWSGARMYRGEFQRRSWKEPVYRGGYGQNEARFGVIAEEDGEPTPVKVNRAAVFANGTTATITNNIGYWKIDSQFLGYDGPASDFALWNGRYHHRLRGKEQPLLDSRIAILRSDENGDGVVDWMEAAMWHRKTIRPPNPPYAGPTFVYKIINAWGPPPPKNNPVTTFDESLEIVRKISEITGGLPQIAYLVGWQFGGHDDGFPALDRVSESLGGNEKLRFLAHEAKKYNAIISYHINLDDAYKENPDWDPSVLCKGRDGQPYPWMFYKGPGVHRQAYHISHTKEIESGYFQKRAQAFLNTVPAEKTIHLDTFRYSNLNFELNDPIGMNEELELGCKEIFRWFAARGIDITSEGPYDGFYGVLSYFWHWTSALRDPFLIVMMHGKAYGGGKPKEPVGEMLGWSIDRGFQAHPHQFGRVFSVDEVSDTFYLGTPLQHYLA